MATATDHPQARVHGHAAAARAPNFLASPGFGELGLRTSTDYTDREVLNRVLVVAKRVMNQEEGVNIDPVKDYLRFKGVYTRYSHLMNAWKVPSSSSNLQAATVGIEEVIKVHLSASFKQVEAEHAKRADVISVEIVGAARELAQLKDTPGFNRFYDACNKEAFVGRYGDAAYSKLKEANTTFKQAVKADVGSNKNAQDKIGYWMWVAMGQPTKERARQQFGMDQSVEEYGYRVLHDLKSSGPAAEAGSEVGFATLQTKLDACERMVRFNSWKVLETVATLFDDKGVEEGLAAFKIAMETMPEGMANKIYKMAYTKCGNESKDLHFGRRMMAGEDYRKRNHALALRSFLEEDKKFPFALENCKQYEKYGCHFTDDGKADFRVYAPNAKSVAIQILSSDGEEVRHSIPMEKEGGDWKINLPDIERGETVYRYLVETPTGEKLEKTDPFAVKALLRGEKWPVAESYKDGYEFQDKDFKRSDALIISGLNLSSFDKTVTGTPFLSIHEQLQHLITHCKKQNITHVQLNGLIEHLDEASRGYHQSQHFAPTSRFFSSPRELKEFVNALHCEGIAVILDVSLNQLPKDSSGMTNFDGTPLYEAEYWDPEFNESYGSAIAGFDKDRTNEYMASMLVYWAKECHIDGFRVDYAIRNYHHLGSHQDSVDPAGISSMQKIVSSVKKECGDSVLFIAENGSRFYHETTGPVGLNNTNSADVRWTIFDDDRRRPKKNDDGDVFEPGVGPGFSISNDFAATPPKVFGHNKGYNAFWYAIVDQFKRKHTNDIMVYSHDNTEICTANQRAHEVGGFPHERMMHAINYLLLPGVHTLYGADVGSESGDFPYIDPSDQRECIAKLTAAMGKLIIANPAMHWKAGESKQVKIVYEHVTDGVLATKRVEGNNEIIIIHDFGNKGSRGGRRLEGVKVDGADFEVIFDSNAKEFHQEGAEPSEEIQEEFRANCGVADDGTLMYWSLPETTLVLRRKVGTYA